VGSIQTAVDDLLESAQYEVIAVTYSITLGAEGFLDGVQSCLDRGVRVDFVINRMSNQNAGAIARIRGMAKGFSRFSVFDFVDPNGADLHSKLIVVDRTRAVVGSANLSFNGMVRNHELALLIDDPAEAELIGETVDRLFRSEFVTRIQSE